MSKALTPGDLVWGSSDTELHISRVEICPEISPCWPWQCSLWTQELYICLVMASVDSFTVLHSFDSRHFAWNSVLIHWGRDKMAAIFQTTFWNAFSWMNMYEFRLKFHWNLFLRVQLTISQHWCRWWLGPSQATSHYLNPWWYSLLTHICVTWPQWVNTG